MRVKLRGPFLWQVVLPALGSALIVLAASFLVFLPKFEENLIEQKRQAIRQEAQIACGILAEFHKLETEKVMTRSRAQELAARTLRDLRFGPGNKDYFWVNDMGSNLIVHPYRRDLEGSNVGNYADAKGKKLFAESVEVVRAQHEGYVEYIWQWKDNPDRLEPKQSFVKGFEPWGWVVGTGVYLDDVEREVYGVTHILVVTTLIVFGLVLALSSYLVYLAARGEHRRRLSHDKQLASERRLSNVIDFLPDATFVLDDEKRVICWNRAMEEVSGIAADDVLGKPDYSYAVPFYGETRPLLVDLVFDYREELAAKYEFLQRDANRVTAEAYASAQGKHFVVSAGPLYDPDGSVVGAIETLRDISHVKSAERERERLREQLDRSQRLEAFGKLAGGIAHDFNNLLVPIMGYSELLADAPGLGDDEVEMVENITAASTKARKLTQQLLAFSRRQPIETTTLDLNEIVRGFERIARGALREDIELSFQLSPSLGTIRGGVAQMEQVLMNLIVNGQDAMPQGGRLTVETAEVELDDSFCTEHPEARPGKYVRLTVSDTGIGMSDTVREQAFDPFFTTKAEGRGTGLGLSTVYGIVKQHDGHIWVYSQPGLGTAFKLYFPARGEPACQTADARMLPVHRGSERVLVVEDDEMVRELVATFLGNLGYDVVATSRPEEAVRLVEGDHMVFDVLVSDVIMPRMNGPQLYGRISRTCPRLAVLFMSGYTGDIMEHHGILDTDARLILKPFTLTALSAKIRDVLRRPTDSTSLSCAPPS